MLLPLRRLIGVAVGLLSLGALPGGAIAGDAKTELRVALYEYVPGYGEGDPLAGFRDRVVELFENENPKIDLVLPKLSDAYSSYNPDHVMAWLGDGKDGERYDLVEIDTLLLGDVIEAVQPWDLEDRGDYIDAGLAAGTIDQKLYAVPHLLCGHFLFGRDSDLDDVTGQEALVAILGRQAGDNVPDLVGDFAGSWNLPALYLDAWKDSFPEKNPKDALAADIDLDIALKLKTLTDLCRVSGRNPCIDETYQVDSPGEFATIFAQGYANAVIGYSERLHYILKGHEPKASNHFSSAPLGAGSSPLVFADGFVLSAKCKDACRHAAKLFVAFINRPEIQEMLLLGLDGAKPGETSIPRYLLAATKSVYERPLLREDTFYPRLRSSLDNASAFPNQGFKELRKHIRDEVEKVLKQ